MSQEPRNLPKTLNDGTHTYRQVRPEELLEDGRRNAALYEREPIDPEFQFTPDLAFAEGLVDTPRMIPLRR